MESPRRVRTRFAPSPTGFLHIGGVRSALYNELLASQAGGDFILRIEDTDQSRFVPGSIEDICRSLAEIGIVPNEGVWLDGNGSVTERGDMGPYTQSARKDIHAGYAAKLVEMGKAYYCFCTAERLADVRKTQELMGKPTMYDGQCRNIPLEQASDRIAGGENHVIRLKLPREGKARVRDAIRDLVEFEWALIDDQVIIKSDGFPTYHLAAMCDDHDMGITHVIRGEEWLSSTPKHVFIYECFGWELPVFAHLPLLLNPDRSKLSKRQGDVAAHDFLDKGYLPEALLNFVALLGWNPTSDRELYTHDELVKLFDLSKINKAGAVLNMEKLDWMNEQYLKQMTDEKFFVLFSEKLFRENLSENIDGGRIMDVSNDEVEFMRRCAISLKGRIKRLTEINDAVEELLEPPDLGSVSLQWKEQTKDEALNKLQKIREYLTSPADLSDQTRIETELRALVAQHDWNNGETFWPLRVALSGKEKSPSPFELLWVLGQSRSLKRLDGAIAFLKA